MNSIGRIYGEIISDEIKFASKSMYYGNFVKIVENESTDSSLVQICQVVERIVHNHFLSSPDIINYINDDIDLQKDTIYSYKIRSIGVLENGDLSSKYVNAIPGKNVYAAESEEVSAVCGIEKTGQQVGYLKKMPNCPIMLNIQKLFNPHLFIVGRTGSGKSFFTKGFLANLNEIFWVFSPTDEYSDLSSYANCEVYNSFVMKLDIENIGYYADLNASEEMILKKIPFEKERIYTHKDIVGEIYKYYREKSISQTQQTLFGISEDNIEIELPTYANNLISKLKSIRNLKFSKSNSNITYPGGSAVFELGAYSQVEQECIINYYLFNLSQQSKAKKNDKAQKHIIIIEEAHNYVPSVRNPLSKSILVKLSREGRKYGISLCFITQRPRFFDQTALSQSGNKIIFSLPNPDDVKYIMEDIPFYKPELSAIIPNQKTGECIIAGDAFNDVLEVVIHFTEESA